MLWPEKRILREGVNVRPACFVLLAAAAAVLPLAGAISGPVKVQGGTISGVPGRTPSITVFKGIPFAAPPVGDLRWRAPEPVIPWRGVKKADTFGASCIQTLSGPNGMGPWTYEFMTHNEISEDCLYLNLWTPAKSAAAKLPVFVWVYGGAFNSGSGQVPIYDGNGLAAKGLVVVNFNYRVGILGFLAHPELTAESGHHASGDYGLLDQVAALRWVRDNIAAFGGDPDRVTVAGQSAGSMSVHFLTASPLAKGLFQGAIEESGGSGVGPTGGGPMMGSRTLADAEADGARFATAKGAAGLRDLRAMSWQKLVEPVAGAPQGSGGMRFSPIVDGYFLPEAPFEAMLHGKLADVPVLTGCTIGEITGNFMGPGGPITPEAFEKQAHQRFGESAGEFLKLYPAANSEQAQASRAASSRDESLVSLYLWARKRAATAKTSTYIYLWDHTLPGPNAARYGAFHSSELPYIFDTLYMSDRPFTDEDRKIAETLSSYWANFATSGNPNGKGLPAWPAVDAQRVVMEIGERDAPVPLAGDAAKCAFFEKYLTR
jgi:para-nitrobenzyl esterase